MKRPLALGSSLVLTALVVGAAVLLGLSMAGVTAEKLRIAVADFVFLSDAGPQLGRRPPPANIVLVLFDRHSVEALGALPTREQDLDLYHRLVEGGARVVADTRMVADSGGDPAVGGRALLDAMADIAPDGRLVRDVWTPANWPVERSRGYRPLIAHNLINTHANADGFFESRLYPLVGMAGDGVFESMPLLLARRIRGIPQPPAQRLLDQVKGSGIAAAWQQALPTGMNLPAELRADGGRAGPYSLGGLTLGWRAFDSKTPLVAPAGYWIDYRSVPSGFKWISYADAGDAAAAGTFAGKVVLIGYDAVVDPTSDTYPVPSSDARAAAAEVVAVALTTLLQPPLMRPMSTGLRWTTTLLFALAAALLAGLLRPLAATAGVAGLLAAFLFLAVVGYRGGQDTDLVSAPLAILLCSGLIAAYRYRAEVRMRRRIVDLFGRYVPKAVVTELVQRPEAEALAVGGVKREVTVLFADIRGFTSYSERHAPEEVLQELNSLLRIMVDCTFANQGTVDKFIGDAILVLFNAPLDQPDHPRRAARTAWAIQQGLKGHPSGLSVGIGVHTGEAVVGTVGTPQRMEYTAVGSTVNVASRLCGVAAGGQVVVSSITAKALESAFELLPQPPVQVKGIDGELSTSLLLRPRDRQEVQL